METSRSILPIQTQTFKARKFILVIPIILIAGVFLIPKNDGNQNFSIYFLIGAIAIFLFIWIALQKVALEINDNSLVYTNIFKTVEIQWKDVSKTYIKYRQHGKSGSHYWYFETWDGRKIRFRVSLFSRNNLQAVADALLSKSKAANIDERIIHMAEGKFPWYVF